MPATARSDSIGNTSGTERFVNSANSGRSSRPRDDGAAAIFTSCGRQGSIKGVIGCHSGSRSAGTLVTRSTLSLAAFAKFLTASGIFSSRTDSERKASMPHQIKISEKSPTIVRKDSGKGWKDYTKKLAKKAGLDEPTD